MNIKHLLGAAVLLLAAHVGIAKADGTFIPASNRTDMVYDAQRDLIYIANGSNVLRYNITQGGFLAPIDLGGNLVGMDLSTDDNTLAVTDSTNDGTHEWVHLVNLDSLTDTKAILPVPAAGGTRTVAFVADGSLMVTSAWQAERLDMTTGTWSIAAAPGGLPGDVISASGDGTIIAAADSGSIPGFWGVYNVGTDQYVQNPDIPWFTYEIATNCDGSQFAVPTYGGVLIYDKANNLLATIGTYAGQEPVGAAYHPVENEIFFPWEGTDEVRVYDTSTFAELGSFDFQDTFAWNGNNDYVQGHTRISRDGSLLMVSVTNGVRFLRMYSPLTATSFKVNTNRTLPTRITLMGSIGNQGSLSYTLGEAPTHGQVTIDGDTATYTHDSGYSGVDSFSYIVHYGRATATGRVTLTSHSPGSPRKPGPPIKILAHR